MMSGADGAGAHGEAAGLDTGLADADYIGCAELAGQVRERHADCTRHLGTEPCGAYSVSGVAKEVSALHGSPLLRMYGAGIGFGRNASAIGIARLGDTRAFRRRLQDSRGGNGVTLASSSGDLVSGGITRAGGHEIFNV